MPKKLFRVTVENVLYVQAEHEVAAVALAQKVAAAELEHAEVIARQVKPDLAYIDPDWRDSPPYGGDDTTTCAELIQAAQAEAAKP